MPKENLTTEEVNAQVERADKLTVAFLDFSATHGIMAQELIGACLNCIEQACSFIPEGHEDITIVAEKMVSNGQNMHALAKAIRDMRATVQALEAQRETDAGDETPTVVH